MTHTDSGSLEINWLFTIVNAFTKFLGQSGRQHRGFCFYLVRPILRGFGMGCLSNVVISLSTHDPISFHILSLQIVCSRPYQPWKPNKWHLVLIRKVWIRRAKTQQRKKIILPQVARLPRQPQCWQARPLNRGRLLGSSTEGRIATKAKGASLFRQTPTTARSPWLSARQHAPRTRHVRG